MIGLSLTELRAKLMPRVDGSLAITPDLHGSEPLAAHWRVVLGSDTLIIAEAAIQEDAAGNIAISGKAALMRIEDLPVVLTFFSSRDPAGTEEEALECLIVPRGFPATWQLDALYPDLPGYLDFSPERMGLGRQRSFLRDIAFYDVAPVYSSFNFTPAEAGDAPVRRATLDEAPQPGGRPLRAGVTFTGELEYVGEIAAAFAEATAEGLGRYDILGLLFSEGEPQLELIHSLVDPTTGKGPGLSLGGAGTFAIDLREIRLTSGLEADGPGPGFAMRGDIAAEGITLSLDIAFAVGAPHAAITGRFGATPLTLPQLERALGLGALGGYLPTPVESLGGLGLARLEADLGLSPLRLERLAFVITTEHPWTIVKDIISVQPVLAFELVQDGADTQTALSITGDWMLGSTRFDTFVAPDTGEFAAYMAVGETLDVGAVLERFLPGVEHPDCVLMDLDLYGNYLDGSAGFEIVTQGGWSFHLGGTELGIRDIALSGDYDGSSFSGALRGTLDVSGWMAKVDVAVTEQITVDVRLPEVNITEILDEFLTFVGIPAELPDFDLQDLDISVTPSTGAFRISGVSDSQIDLFPGFRFQLAQFSAAREVLAAPSVGGVPAPAKVAAQMQWMLHLGPADAQVTVALSADYNSLEGDSDAVGTEWTFEGILSDGSLPVGHMLDALEHLVGLDYPLPTAGLDITDLFIGFNIGAEERHFVISFTLAEDKRVYGRFSLVALRTLADDQAEEPPWSYAVNFEADLDIGMGDLPLVGPPLDEIAQMKLHALQMTIASRAFPSAEVARMRLLLPSRAVHPADGTLADGTNFAVQATLGDDRPSFRVPVALSGAPPASAIPAPAPGSLPPTPQNGRAPAPSRIDTTKWFPVHRGFGAVELARIGLRFQNAELTVLLDAEVGLASLQIGFLGLGLTSPLDHFQPSVSLEGISIAYDGGAVSISGGLKRTPEGGFSGLVRLAAEAFALTAMGQYVTVDGHTSIFVFGVLDAPIGGPPCCFIHGIAAGIGINSALHLPAPENVGDFALVRAAMPGGNPLGGGTDLAEVLRTMGDDIRPTPGAEWLAAGIRFTSFEIVQSVALLTVTLDSKPRINLLGLSRLSIPPLSPSPIAMAEIGLLATIDPDAGLLAVEGALTRNSFLLSHECRPTGGFAFYTWFRGPHEGDFVLTLGGYHPHFPVPAHYPQVPRITMQWRLSDNLELKGTSYLALVPNMIMAGSAIEVVFQAGDLRAWFNARYDVLISWKPFHYEIEVAICVGASLRINLLFTSFTLTVHVGAGLVLHGPPFGGEAYVDISVISFTIPFGQGRPDPTPISWQEFKQSFLPPPVSGTLAPLAVPPELPGVPVVPTNAICTIQVVDGLTRDLTGQPGYDGPLQWIANPERFAVSTQSLIPSKAATLNTTALPVAWSQGFGIGPVALAEDAFQSTHHVRFEKFNHATRAFEPFPDLVATPVLRNVPAALWRHGSLSDMGSAAVVDGTLGGFVLRPPPIVPDVTCTIAVSKLLFDHEPVRAFQWSSPAKPVPATARLTDSGETLTVSNPAGASVENRAFVLAGLLDPATAARRESVVAALRRRGAKLAPAIDLDGAARMTLADWPRVCGLGAEVE